MDAYRDKFLIFINLGGKSQWINILLYHIWSIKRNTTDLCGNRKNFFLLLASGILLLKYPVVWQTSFWMCNLFFTNMSNWKLTKLIKVLITSVNIQLKNVFGFCFNCMWIDFFFSAVDLYKLILQLDWSVANSKT